MQTIPVVQPPERERVSDWAYGQIRAAVLQGLRRPGDRLSIPVLATELGVSRSPVRDAVQRLVQDGLADEQAHRGAFVAHVTADELHGVYAVREVLEGLVARTAAETLGAVDVAALEDLVGQHHDAVERGDMEAHFDLDIRFHREMRLLTRNDTLITLLAQIQGKIQLAMLTTSVYGGAAEAVHDHEQILEAVKSRDPDAAEQTARIHIARLRAALEDLDGGMGDD